MAHEPPESPEKDAEIARDCLARGDLRHAVEHIAGALATDPEHAEWLELLGKILSNAEAPLALAPTLNSGGSIHFASAAVRARVLADASQFDDALRTIFQVLLAKPDVNYFPWAHEWLARPGAAADVSAETYGWFMASWGKVSSDPAHLDRIRAVAKTATIAHPDEPLLVLLRAALLRGSGRLDEALAVGLEAFEAGPSHLVAVSIASTHREMGDFEKAVDYFGRAVALAPDEIPVHLDLGDTLLRAGRLGDAARVYDGVLARAPGHPWALPSVQFIRWKATADPALADRARQDLARLAASGNERARTLLGELSPRA